MRLSSQSSNVSYPAGPTRNGSASFSPLSKACSGPVTDLELSQVAPRTPLVASNPSTGRVAYGQEPDAIKEKLEDKGIELWAVRHGQSEMNATGHLLPGQIETPLTQEGRDQAFQAAQDLYSDLGGESWLRDLALHPEKGPAVYASPLSRASDTAQIFVDYVTEQATELGLNVPLAVTEDQKLMEISFGQYEGRSDHDAFCAHPELMGDADLAHKFPGGESRLDVLNRVSSFLEDVAETHHDQPVLMFCHLVPVATAKILMGDGTTGPTGDLEIHRQDFPNASPIQLTHPEPSHAELDYIVA